MAAPAQVDNELPCVHCGLCLNTCPTYRVLGTEADSPRGRIYIMEAIASGELSWNAAAAAHLDSCLGCLACETACPSGVEFGRRIEAFRPRLPRRRATHAYRAWLRYLATSPRLLDTGRLAAQCLDAVGLESLRRRWPTLGLLPARAAGRRCDPRVAPLSRSAIPPPSEPRLKVALLTGCASDRLAPQINRAAVEVLHRNGIAVTEVDGQGCCGALARHAGAETEAVRLARVNTTVFSRANVEFVVTTAAGCSAHMRDYPHLLGSSDERAHWLGSHTRDVCELLVEVGFEPPLETIVDRVAYLDACHLRHGCGISQAPRAVVRAATGQEPIDLGENEICCGSAGSYNLEHARMAGALGARKAELAASLDIDTIAAGNTGCLLQIERALRLRGIEVRTVHPAELLAEAYRASETSESAS